MAHDVFLSYSSKDKTVADAACAMLEAKGVRCWMAPRDIMPGSEWGAAIIEAIGAARIMVLIYTASSNASPQVRREVERAVARGLHVIPFRVEDVPMSPALEYFISSPHWLDAISPPLERHLDHLARIVQAVMEAQRTGTAAGLDPLDPGPTTGGTSPSTQSAGWTHGPPPGSFVHGAPPAGATTSAAAPTKSAASPKPHGGPDVPRLAVQRSRTPLLVGGGVSVLVVAAVLIVFATFGGDADEKRDSGGDRAAAAAAAQAPPDDEHTQVASGASVPTSPPPTTTSRPAGRPIPGGQAAQPVVRDAAGRPPAPPLERGLTEAETKAFWELLSQDTLRAGIVRQAVARHPELLNERNTGGNTPLYEAAKASRSDTVSLLLALDADRQARSEGGNTALHAAAASGSDDGTVIAGLAEGAVDATNDEGDAPLHVAIKNGHAVTAQLLLAAEADPNLADRGDRRPLSLALELAKPADAKETARALLKRGATLDWEHEQNRTVLHAAVRLGDAALVKSFIDKGAPPDAADAAGRTPLHVAVEAGDAQVVKLLAAGKAMTVADDKGNTPLHLAAAGKGVAALATARALLTAGADVSTATRQKQTPLHVAAATGNLPMVELLLSAKGGAAVLANGTVPTRDEAVAKYLVQREIPVLLRAAIASTDQKASAELLEKLGAKPKPDLAAAAAVRVSGGRNALHDAAAADKVDLIPLLLAADPALIESRTDKAFETPLHLAAKGNRVGAAKALLDHGALVLTTNEDAETPLHLAARAGAADVVKVLLDAGADPNASRRKSNPATPADVATDRALKEQLKAAEDEARDSAAAWKKIKTLSGRQYTFSVPEFTTSAKIHFSDGKNFKLSGLVNREDRTIEGTYVTGPLSLNIDTGVDALFPGRKATKYGGKVTVGSDGESFIWNVSGIQVTFEPLDGG